LALAAIASRLMTTSPYGFQASVHLDSGVLCSRASRVDPVIALRSEQRHAA